MDVLPLLPRVLAVWITAPFNQVLDTSPKPSFPNQPFNLELVVVRIQSRRKFIIWFLISDGQEPLSGFLARGTLGKISPVEGSCGVYTVVCISWTCWIIYVMVKSV